MRRCLVSQSHFSGRWLRCDVKRNRRSVFYMERETSYAGNLMLEIEEIKNMEDKSDEEVRMSFSSICGTVYTIICC